MLSKKSGAMGEEMAKEFLLKKGYAILNQNFKTKFGEVDIICEDNGIIVFVEVKNRESDKFGLGLESITKSKQNKIRKVALFYLQQNGFLARKVRFDAIDILRDKIKHLENCF